MGKEHYKKYFGYYKKNKGDLFRAGALFLLMLTVIYILHFIISIPSNRGLYASIVAFMASWYYIFDVVVVFRIQKRAIVNQCGRECIFWHRYLSLGVLLFSACSIVLSLFYKIDLNVVLLVFVPLLFVGMAYFTMLFMFEEDYYYSGGFKIFYSEIDHIEVEDELSTIRGIVVVCRLMKGENIVGYDRMMVEDYVCLKNKIEENKKEKSFE